ncbi:MAG: hypothetical protein JWN04_3241 [Myxococcaceae bacterium]|nr:hypothetical protein [Myxococcaceae bacterium]
MVSRVCLGEAALARRLTCDYGEPMHMATTQIGCSVFALWLVACGSDSPRAGGDSASATDARVASPVEDAANASHTSRDGAAGTGVDGGASMIEAGPPIAKKDGGGSNDAQADGGRLGTGHLQMDQGCVSHADCAPGLVCYLGYDHGQTCLNGPSGSCATCQGGECLHGFECSCLPQSLCFPANPCTDNGKVIVCPSAHLTN